MSLLKGVLLLHFLLDWVLLSSSGFSQRGGTSCPDLGFFVMSLLDKMFFDSPVDLWEYMRNPRAVSCEASRGASRA